MDTHFLEKRVVTLMVAVVMAASMVWACDDEEAVDGPEEVATGFLDTLRQGDQQAAMQKVWPSTREELEEAAEKLEAHTEGDAPVGLPDLLVVTRLESPFLFASIDIDGEVPASPSDGEKVVLTIEYRDGRTADIVVRWAADDRRWYVDLPLDERRSLHVLDEFEQAPKEDRGDDEEGGGEELDSTDDEIMDDE